MQMFIHINTPREAFRGNIPEKEPPIKNIERDIQKVIFASP